MIGVLPLAQIRSMACSIPGLTWCRNSFSATASRFYAALAEGSCTDLVMAYLFYCAGQQCEPGLSFALLGTGYTPH